MPTKAELDALIETKSNTTDYTWTWCDGSTEKYNDTEVKGWKIVRNATSATLFLPAAGYRLGTSLYDAGSHGYYWSSSLDTGIPYRAWRVDVGSGGVYRNGNYRYLGQSVRPVSE